VTVDVVETHLPGMLKQRPIGVFDSGLGGISVLRALLEVLPNESFIYVADTAHVPYGGKDSQEIFQRMYLITQFLLSKGCKAIVVACNTATAAGIEQLRQQFPDLPIIAIEPAIKPAVLQSQTKKIAVLATYHTIHSERVSKLIAQHAGDCQVVLQACPGLADSIEHLPEAQDKMMSLVQTYLQPLLTQSIDVVVLGCTHYPLINSEILNVLGTNVLLLEPGHAVAKQLVRQLEKYDLQFMNDHVDVFKVRLVVYATAQATRLQHALARWVYPIFGDLQDVDVTQVDIE
jgi:glutamate racemase